ncbi:hypothetical protein CC1G_00810 [Coprinopsis cinerea okayama7|uniref:Uncharacterized protein n=1 Tax=Coprinopsis cinerea (strain Okayama-7 / 130 / ATCC MYA-4618 / FGSC 9003) TaxID=240176 RepID=A8N8T5_COPC7|nr:hypothetical protein CC1G_00810 [Coprinopsis cinerea okayama7\|eukprot:XP_001831263.2 hypothetical protein CC1G_00810 [Coprinopsis cinerea okayama7\
MCIVLGRVQDPKAKTDNRPVESTAMHTTELNIEGKEDGELSRLPQAILHFSIPTRLKRPIVAGSDADSVIPLVTRPFIASTKAGFDIAGPDLPFLGTKEPYVSGVSCECSATSTIPDAPQLDVHER